MAGILKSSKKSALAEKSDTWLMLLAKKPIELNLSSPSVGSDLTGTTLTARMIN